MCLHLPPQQVFGTRRTGFWGRTQARWVSSLVSPSHRGRPFAAATSPPIGVALGSQRRGWGTARAPPVCMPAMTLGRRACIGTHHTRRPHRCVRGALNGAIASACAAVHRAPNHDRAPPPFPRPSNLITPGQSPSCYSSRKLSVRARGSHRCTLRVGASRSRSNRTRTRAFDARRSALARIAARVQPAGLHAALRTEGRGRGALVGAAPSRLARVRPRLARPPAT